MFWYITKLVIGNFTMKNLVLHHYMLGTSPYIVECSDWVFFTVFYLVIKQYSIGSLHFYAMFFHYIIHGKLPWFTSHSDKKRTGQVSIPRIRGATCNCLSKNYAVESNGLHI